MTSHPEWAWAIINNSPTTMTNYHQPYFILGYAMLNKKTYPGYFDMGFGTKVSWLSVYAKHDKNNNDWSIITHKTYNNMPIPNLYLNNGQNDYN